MMQNLVLSKKPSSLFGIVRFLKLAQNDHLYSVMASSHNALWLSSLQEFRVNKKNQVLSVFLTD